MQYKTKTMLEGKFGDAIKKDLINNLNKEEKIRISLLKRFIITLSIFIAVIVVLVSILITKEAEEMASSYSIHLVVASLAFVIALLLPYIFNEEYKSELKHNLSKRITRIFEIINKNKEDETDCRLKYGNIDISNEVIKQSKLFGNFDTLYKNDCFSGTYKKVDFKFFEASLEKGYGKSKTTLFQGLLLHTKTNKPFENSVYIKSKKSIYPFSRLSLALLIAPLIMFPIICLFIVIGTSISLFEILGYIMPALAIWLFLSFSYYNLEKWFAPKTRDAIDIENYFERQYAIVSEDENLAQYLATNALYKKMENLKQVFHARCCSFAFYDKNNIMLSIETLKNLFEYGSLFKKITLIDNFEEFIEQLSAIVDFIDFVQDEYREYYIK